MRFTFALAALAASAAGAAAAHHSFSAEFDPDRPVKFTGKVTEMKWSNPHAWIYVDVTGDDGKVVSWSLEMTGANGLFRRGWRKEDLEVGIIVTIDGYQARSGQPVANAASITLPDGKRLFAGAAPNEGGTPGR